MVLERKIKEEKIHTITVTHYNRRSVAKCTCGFGSECHTTGPGQYADSKIMGVIQRHGRKHGKYNFKEKN